MNKKKIQKAKRILIIRQSQKKLIIKIKNWIFKIKFNPKKKILPYKTNKILKTLLIKKKIKFRNKQKISRIFNLKKWNLEI